MGWSWCWRLPWHKILCASKEDEKLAAVHLIITMMKKIDLDDDFDDDGYIKWGNFGKSWKQKDSAENGDGKDKSNDDDNDFADHDYKRMLMQILMIYI